MLVLYSDGTMDAAGPAIEHEDTVRAAWIDDNDHMNLAYYVLVFEGAIAALAARLGLAGGLRLTQAHTVYEREVRLGDRLRVTTHLLGADAARLHLFQEMRQADEGYRAATFETVAEQGAAFPEPARERIAASLARFVPDGAGRRIALPARRGGL